MTIITHSTTIETLLQQWRTALGNDYTCYRNHVYRLFNYCNAQRILTTEEKEAVTIASAFNSIAIWLDGTSYYTALSAQRANNYLVREGKGHLSAQVRQMIKEHHKITPYTGQYAHLVELFRKADWMDNSINLLSFDTNKETLKAIKAAFPYKGLHLRIGKQAFKRWSKKPFTAVPALKL